MIEQLKRFNRYRNLKFKLFKNFVKRIKLNFSKKGKTVFEASAYNSILIVMCDLGIGDAIVMSFLIYELRKKNYKVSIAVDERIKFLFDSFIKVDNVFVFNRRNLKKFLKSDKNTRIDLAIDLYDESENSLRRVQIISSFKPLHTIGFNQSKFSQYDTSITYIEYDSHITNRSCRVLELLNINYSAINYHLNLQENDRQKAKLILDKTCNGINKFVIIFNPFASNEMRSFSMKQIQSIISFLSQQKNCITIIIGEQKHISYITELPNVFINRDSSFFVTAALISLCDLVITVDTSIVHVTSAYNNRMLAIYNNRLDSNFNINKVWAPLGNNFTQMVTMENLKSPRGDPIFNLDTEIVIKKLKKELLLNVRQHELF